MKNNMDEKNDLNELLLKKAKGIKKRKIIRNCIIVALILFIIIFSKINSKPASDNDEFLFDEVTADVGNVSVVVEGEGTITANSIYNITPKVTGEILEDNVIMNEYVEKGDLLYVIDSKDISSSINQASIGIEQANISIEQAENNYNSVKSQIDDLKIFATADGYIENLKISKGSTISNMMQVCDIREKDSYEVTLEFLTSGASSVNIGDMATLFYVDYLTTTTGYVSKISDSTFLKSTGSQVTNVTIRVETNGYNVQNAKVKGTINTSNGLNLSSVNESTIKSINSNVVVSNSSGVVKDLYVDEGSYVHNGDLIATLENSGLDTQLDNAAITIKNAQVSKKNAQNGLNSTTKQLENYEITAPISGKVVYKNNKKGDVISSYQQLSSNVMATIADVSTLKFETQITQLDIPKVKIGQEVIVKVEALDNKEFIGQVTNINTIGTSVAGMTNYTVVVEMPGVEEIYPGMTVDAKIKINERENVLRVPLTAVRKGDVVYKKSTNPEFQDSDLMVPKGYEKVKVELGLNSDEFIEITSGLTLGDIVLTDKVMKSGTFDLEKLSNARNKMLEQQ